MTRRFRANINSEALVWAREVLGMPLEIAAAKIGVSLDRLSHFESGELRPTENQLRKIGYVYRKPAPFFYLRSLPEKPDQLHDYRVVGAKPRRQSPALIDAILRARERRMDALDLARTLDRQIPDFGVQVNPDTSASRLATQLRDRLEVDLRVQQSWREPYVALRSWIEAVESCGVLIMQFSHVDIQEARGFSITDRPYPVIAVNGGDWPHARVFTLFHELAHIAMDLPGVCDLRESERHRDSIEVFCNRVAGEALVPATALLNDLQVERHASMRWSDSILADLAKKFSVSREVILRRLLVHDRTTRHFYREKRREFIEGAEARREQKPGFMHHFRRVLRDNGRTFTGLALAAYNIEAISSLELSRILGGMKLKHVGPIEEALSAG